MPSSSEQRPTIHVQTLGGFSIRTNGCQINDNSNQSKKPWALLFRMEPVTEPAVYRSTQPTTTE